MMRQEKSKRSQALELPAKINFRLGMICDCDLITVHCDETPVIRWIKGESPAQQEILIWGYRLTLCVGTDSAQIRSPEREEPLLETSRKVRTAHMIVLPCRADCAFTDILLETKPNALK